MLDEVKTYNWINHVVNDKVHDSHTKVRREIMFKNKIKRLPFIHIRLKNDKSLNVVWYDSHYTYKKLTLDTTTNHLNWLSTNIPVLLGEENTPIIVIDKGVWVDHSKYLVGKIRPALTRLLDEHNTKKPKYKNNHTDYSQL